MPKNLIIFGLGLIAAWLLLHLVSFVMAIALWTGGLLVVIGIIWALVARSDQRA